MGSSLYVELDAIFDTRLGTIAGISQDAAIKLVESPNYYQRQRDDFAELCGIDLETFQAAYKVRDVETLKRSIMTEAPFTIGNIIDELERQADATPEAERMTVELNIWPYALSDEESDIMALGLQRFTGVQTQVRIVNMSPEQLTPRFIKERYFAVVMYNFNDWIGIHPTLWGPSKMPRVMTLVPALFFEAPPDADDPELAVFKEHDHFGIAEQLLGVVINVQFLDIATFCIFRHWLHPEMRDEVPEKTA